MKDECSYCGRPLKDLRQDGAINCESCGAPIDDANPFANVMALATGALFLLMLRR